MFQFQTLEDMHRVWSLGSVNLNPGVLRLIPWSPTFSPKTYKNTFAHVWVRFWDLGYAYWEHQTLFEIAKGVGMPIKLDPRTTDRSLGLYARILVEVDFSRPLLDQLKVFRAEGHSVTVGIEYETKPNVCGLCGLVGHLDSNCKVKVHLEENISLPKRCRSIKRDRRSRHRNLSTQKLSLNRVSRSVAQKHVESDSGDRIDSKMIEKEAFAAEKEVFLPASPIDVGLVTAPIMNVVTTAADALSSSTIDSVPPGFLVKHLEREDTELLVSLMGVRDNSLSNSLEAMSPTAPEDSQEDGEFTPILHKKTKKKLKNAEKTLLKPLSRAHARALPLKGTKHKRFL